jgi:hypothetical protein
MPASRTRRRGPFRAVYGTLGRWHSESTLVVEQMKVPDQTMAAETERAEASGGDLAMDRVNREELDREPG